MTSTKKPIRIKIVETWPAGVSDQPRISYIVIDKGKVNYLSCTDSCLAMSNLFGAKTAETRFALEDCRYEDHALTAVRRVLSDRKHIKVDAI